MDVARESFQTLLNVSLHESDSVVGGSGGGVPATPSASMDALLRSCEDVLRRYVADEVAMAGEEMPADRTAEAVYMIESVRPIISPSRRAVAASLFPLLCRLATCGSLEVRRPLAVVLQLYSALLE